MEKNIEKLFDILRKREIADPKWLKKNRQDLILHMHSVSKSGTNRLRGHEKGRSSSSEEITGGVAASHYLNGKIMRFLRPSRIMPIFIAFALIVTGSLSVAANSSLPGDALFPWKTGVNERVQSTLVVGTENQAKFEMNLVKKRLVEVEQLIAKHNAKAEAKVAASANLEAQAKDAENNIAKLGSEENGDSETIAKFDAALNAHKEILARLESRVEDKPHLENAIDTINRVIIKLEDKSEQMQARAEEKLSELPVGAGVEENIQAEAKSRAESKIEIAGKRIDITAEFIVKAEERGSIVIRAEEMLNSAGESLAKAKASLDAQHYLTASAQAQEAIILAAKAQGMVEVHNTIDPSVREVINLIRESSKPPMLIVPSPKATSSDIDVKIDGSSATDLKLEVK